MKMRSVKEKVSNAASAGQEHIDIYKAQAQEKAEKATARTKEEEVIAHEKRKAKEAEAKMNLHEAKSEHAADKLYGKHSVPLHHHDRAGTTGHHLPGQGHQLYGKHSVPLHHHDRAGTTGHHHQPVGTGVADPKSPNPAGEHPPGHNTYI